MFHLFHRHGNLSPVQCDFVSAERQSGEREREREGKGEGEKGERERNPNVIS